MAPPSERKPATYDCQLDEQGVLTYRYRGSDRHHRDNVGLRQAIARQVPLVYFYGLVPGWYEAIWPVYVVGDDPARLTFKVLAEDQAFARGLSDSGGAAVAEGRRRYVTTLVQRRLHQHAFRERVLRAYRERCGICQLRHRELLDAAHIVPDRHPRGEPLVPKGWRCARRTTPPSTDTCSASAPI